MATATGAKTVCLICQKAAGVFTCRGCGKDFCYRHVAEHRQELNKQMDEVTANHDQLQQTIAEQEVQPNCHPLMKKVDEWEEESINKIHQAADNVRKELLTILDGYKTQVRNKLANLTTELSKARNEDDYVETDLKEWVEKLDKLKIDLTAAHTIDFGQNNDGNSLIPKLFINDTSNDIFYQTAGDVQIIEDGRVVIHGSTNNLAVARCRGKYSLGQHRFRFKIEQLSRNNGFSCGIISENTPMSSVFSTAVCHNTFGQLYVVSAIPGTYPRLNQDVAFSFNEQNCNFQLNGIYELLIDCNRQTMRLTNEQLGNTQELNVNLPKYPFPWQFFITLLYTNDRVCLC